MQTAFLGLVSAVLFLFVAITLSNVPLLWALGKSGALTLGILFSLFGALFTNMTPLLATVTVVNAILFGVIVSLLLARGARSQKGMTIGGTLLALFGSGCASCGALLFGGALPFLGGGALLSFLPLEGGEFALLGTVFLAIALWRLQKKRQEKTCDNSANVV